VHDFPASMKPLAEAIAVGMLGLAVAAHAQGAAAPAPAGSAPAATSPEQQVETVTVSAQGRAQLLQEVPISVKTFSAKEIEKSGITSTQDFINLTPNVAFDQSFTFANSFVTIRGVSQLNNADSPVAVVVDGVPQNNQKQLKMDLFDIQRIEVLKGPQGALFGRNAIGGAITIETKQPTNTFEGFAGLEAGSGATFTESAGISGPLIDDKVLFRIAGESKSSGGSINNVYLDQKVDKIGHDDSLRGKLLVYASPDLKLDFSINANNYEGGATWDSIVKSGDANDIEPPRSSLLGRTEGRTTDFSFRAAYSVDAGTLSAITSYTDLVEKYRGDIDFSNPVDLPGGFLNLGFQAGQGQDLSVKMASQEIRFTSADDRPFRWIAGTLFLNTKRNLETRAFIDTSGSLDQWDDLTKNLVDRNEHNDNNAWSVFGQVEQDLSASTTLAAGLRWDNDSRDQIDIGSGEERKKTFSAVQPKVTLTQHFTRDVIGYGTYSTGFRSGGFNAPGLDNFKAERLSNFEAGVKSTLLDKRLILDASVYYADSHNFQYFYFDAGTGAQLINNIDKVHIKGIDIDFQYLPVTGLQFDGGIGTTDSRIRANAAQPSTVGNYTPKASPFKVNLGVQYTTMLASNLSGYGRFDVEERSRRYWQINNADVQNAMTLMNLRLGLSTAKDVWSGYVFVKNLGDHKYYADFNPAAYSGLGYAVGALAEGRQFGLGAKYRF
jgi:iron complex outermembrane receptor protein